MVGNLRTRCARVSSIRPTINEVGEEDLGILHKNIAGEPLPSYTPVRATPAPLRARRNFHQPFRMTHHHSSKLFQDWRIFQHQMTLVSKSTLLQHHYGTSLLPAGPRIRYRRGGARDAVIDGRFHPASASRATTQQHYRISKFIRQDGVLSV